MLRTELSFRLPNSPGSLESVCRLLADERVNGFVTAFLDAWLSLRDLGSQPPARESARVYYAENLPEAMKTEVRLFFRDLMAKNGSVQRFLDADYTFADKRLARLYNLPEAKTMRIADGFHRGSDLFSNQVLVGAQL